MTTDQPMHLRLHCKRCKRPSDIHIDYEDVALRDLLIATKAAVLKEGWQPLQPGHLCPECVPRVQSHNKSTLPTT